MIDALFFDLHEQARFTKSSPNNNSMNISKIMPRLVTYHRPNEARIKNAPSKYALDEAATMLSFSTKTSHLIKNRTCPGVHKETPGRNQSIGQRNTRTF